MLCCLTGEPLEKPSLSILLVYGCFPPPPLACCGQFHQYFTSSFYARRSKKPKKDSQVKQLFALSGSACVLTPNKKKLMKVTPGCWGSGLVVTVIFLLLMIQWIKIVVKSDQCTGTDGFTSLIEITFVQKCYFSRLQKCNKLCFLFWPSSIFLK